MKQKKTITLLRSENRLVVDPTTPGVHRLLSVALTYKEKQFFRGYELVQRKKLRLPPFEEVEWQVYDTDVHGRIAAAYGFRELIEQVLTAEGYPVRCEYAYPEAAQEAEEKIARVYTPQWDRIEELLKTGFVFRHRQEEALRLIAEHENGRIDCPPAWGKGTTISLACQLFPFAKIDITTKRIPILTQRLYPELSLNLPSVGIWCGAKKIGGKRVMCYSADSLHHGRFADADFLFVDEGHEACADAFAAKVAGYSKARIWMFSASWDMRLDNKDLRAYGLAGPVRIKVTFKEAEEAGAIVPCHVFWTRVASLKNPCEDLDDVRKKRVGVWQNDHRNALIAKDARLYGPDTQVLITTETLEHALALKRFLPEYKLIYSVASATPEKINRYANMGLIPENFVPMTDERRANITKLFTLGRLRKVIATTVWNVGVDFTHLEVLCRGEGGGSAVNDTQIPGRAVRLHTFKDEKGTRVKTRGIIHDYTDEFDPGLGRKASGRRANYKLNEWTQTAMSRLIRDQLRQPGALA